MIGRYIIGVILVSVIGYFIGKLLTAIAGRRTERGIIGNVCWGVMAIGVIAYHHPLMIIAYIILGIIFL